MTRDEFELYNRQLRAGKKSDTRTKLMDSTVQQSARTSKSITSDEFELANRQRRAGKKSDTKIELMDSTKEQLIKIGNELIKERKQFNDSNRIIFRDVNQFVIKHL